MVPASHTLETASRAEPSWREPRQGDVLGRYEILFPLASGGMATVFAARLAGEEGFQKPLALKLMLPHLARDERFVAMFLDEATLASRIASPHVVNTLDLGREGDTLFIAMELIVGASLRDIVGALALRGERMSPRIAASLAMQVAHGLADAHEARGPGGDPLAIVHRDVSPHNVLVGVDGRARLSDFGVALAANRLARTETGEMKGKLCYFSPEQLEGTGVDQRSDVFSLAVVAWECLVGRRLFDATNPLALAAQVARGPIPRADAIAEDVPPEIADVIAAALERDASKRTPSARAFSRALGDALAKLGGVADAAEIGALVRSAAGDAAADVEARLAVCLATPPAWPTGERSAVRSVVAARRRRWGGVAVVGAALALGVGAALVWTALDRESSDETIAGIEGERGARAPVGPTTPASATAPPATLGDVSEGEDHAAGSDALYGEAAAAEVAGAAAAEVTSAEAAAEGATAEVATAEVAAAEVAAAEVAAAEVAAAQVAAAEAAPAEAAPAEVTATEVEARPDRQAERRRRARARRVRRARAPTEPTTAPAAAPRTPGPRLLDVETFDAQRRR